jgi:hypothetical protein
MSCVKNGANQPNALIFCLSDAAAPLLSCSKSIGGSTVAAAASVAANKVVVELTNMSLAIFIVFE